MKRFEDFVRLALAQVGNSYPNLALRTGFTSSQLFNFSRGAPPAARTVDGRSVTPANDSRYLELGRASASASEDAEAAARECAKVAEEEFLRRVKPNLGLFHDEIEFLLRLGLPAEAAPQAQEMLLLVLLAGHAMTEEEIRSLRA